MTRIVPGIQTTDFYELQQKLNKISELAPTAHIDIADGQFVPSTTIGAVELKMIRTESIYNLHLMAKISSEVIDNYGSTDAQTLIIYPQACEDLDKAIKHIRLMDKEVGLVFDPDTTPDKYEDYLFKIDMALIMGVRSGFAGQEFLPQVLSKVKIIRDLRADLTIGVDGGIKVGVAREAAKAGADYIVANSAIWNADVEPKEAYERLVRDVENF